MLVLTQEPFYEGTTRCTTLNNASVRCMPVSFLLMLEIRAQISFIPILTIAIRSLCRLCSGVWVCSMFGRKSSIQTTRWGWFLIGGGAFVRPRDKVPGRCMKVRCACRNSLRPGRRILYLGAYPLIGGRRAVTGCGLPDAPAWRLIALRPAAWRCWYFCSVNFKYNPDVATVYKAISVAYPFRRDVAVLGCAP